MREDWSNRRQLATAPVHCPLPIYPLLIFLAIALATMSASAVMAAAESTEAPTKRLTLATALESLRADGIDTLYTNRLVTEEMTVDQLPAAGPTKQRLRSLLSPLGLAAKATPDGRWAVVAARSATVEGCLVSDPGARPIAAASVVVTHSQQQELSDPAGCYRLLDVAAGNRVIEVSRPGYVSRSMRLSLKPGTNHRADLKLRIDVQASDEIFVATTPEAPALGTWQLSPTQRDSAIRASADLLSAAAEIPGAKPEAGVSFGIRGREARRVSLVIDGMSIVEPYHFRDLGSLASAVPPSAIGDVQLHRGSPPLVYGNRAGGVLELDTVAPTDRFSGRLILNDGAEQASVNGSLLSGRGRWLAAFRNGRPDLPKEIGELDAVPTYQDGIGKASAALSPSQELSLHILWAEDDFSFDRQFTPLPLLGPPPQSLSIGQSSRHIGLRYLISVGSRHLIEALVSDIKVDRLRASSEIRSSFLTPDFLSQSHEIEDRRATQRQVARIDGRSNLTDRVEIQWGLESSREHTTYNYTGSSEFRFPVLIDRFTARLSEQQLGLFSQGTWRPRTDLTIKTGVRWDSDSKLAPRASFSLHRGKAVWSGSWARAVSLPFTYELPLADDEAVLPKAETTDFSSFGYRRSGSVGYLAIEVYQQRITDPRPRFVNLYKPIGRISELEQDRLRLAPEEGRLAGLEIQIGRDSRRWQGNATYLLSRSEDVLNGRRLPRREDRRHSLNARLTLRLGTDKRLNLSWYGATGAPTTPFDISQVPNCATVCDFSRAIGDYHSERLPSEHQLNIRLIHQASWRGLSFASEIGIDNIYNHQRIRGFDLVSLRNDPPPASLPPELGLGRRLKWGFELAW